MQSLSQQIFYLFLFILQILYLPVHAVFAEGKCSKYKSSSELDVSLIFYKLITMPFGGRSSYLFQRSNSNFQTDFSFFVERPVFDEKELNIIISHNKTGAYNLRTIASVEYQGDFAKLSTLMDNSFATRR